MYDYKACEIMLRCAKFEYNRMINMRHISHKSCNLLYLNKIRDATRYRYWIDIGR